MESDDVFHLVLEDAVKILKRSFIDERGIVITIDGAILPDSYPHRGNGGLRLLPLEPHDECAIKRFEGDKPAPGLH